MPTDELRRRRRQVFDWSAAGLTVFLAWQALALAPARRAAVRPPAWDQANHLQVAGRYRDFLRSGDWAGMWSYTPNSSIPPFPPLYHLALAATAGRAEPAADALWVNWLYLGLLTISIFGAVWELRPESAALAAALAFACAPAVQGLLRTPLVDLPLAAVVAASLWAFLRCDGFSRPKASAAFGALFAAGMLHKWSFFSYLLPAYAVWPLALRRRETRANALAAAAIAVGLGAPWYLIRLPLVVIRLTQATNDFVVPFWRRGAFFQYLMSAPAELGWAFVVIAIVAVPRSRGPQRRAARLLLLGTLGAYLFWALLPNRQFRYLLPGLCGLAVAAGAVVPAPVLWTAAVWQIAGAARAVAPRAAPESWPIAAIVREIAVRDPGASVTPVALIANDEAFNKLNFIWTAQRQEAVALEFRGVHDVPWELSPFVVLKEGRLGPDLVTSEFRAAAAEIARPGGWFSRAFESAARWPLPDGSTAVLFARRRLAAPPFAARRVSLPLYVSSLLSVPRAELAFGPWDARAGAYRFVRFSAPEVFVGGLAVADVRLELLGAVLVPDAQSGVAGARLVRVDGVRVLGGGVGAAALRARLEKAGLRVDALMLDGTISVAAHARGLPVSVELSAGAAGPGRPCEVRVAAARLGPLALPPGLFERYGLNGKPLELETKPGLTTLRTVFGLHRSLPFAVELPGCSARAGALSVP